MNRYQATQKKEGVLAADRAAVILSEEFAEAHTESYREMLLDDAIKLLNYASWRLR